ncbi:MAG TPA: fibronectin type III domain-containing protein [Hanamia sp.]|nr:fibronectin type III domain-containing protein [Hanamia sp.]
MKTLKVNVSFTKLSDADFLNKAEHVLQSMTGNPAFPNPIPTLAEVQAAITKYSNDLVLAQGLGKVNVANKNQSRLALEKLLAQLAMFVMFVANGDETILISSGYTLSKTPEPNHIDNPGNVILSNGITSGEMVSAVKGQRAVKSYLHQITAELPTDTTLWESTATSRSKFVFTNLQPGKQYWVRVAAIGGNEQSAFSSIATQFVQ